MPTARRWDAQDGAAILSIFLSALSLRTILACLTPVIGGDSSAFLLPAHEISLGDWDTGLKSGIHPGYPVAILALGSLLGSLEAGGYAVSILFSSIAAAGFYVWVRDLSGPRTAWISGLLLAFLPYFILEHSAIMTEGLFLFFFLASVSMAWYGATRERLLFYVLSGMAGGLAYLTRGEGIYSIPAVVGITLIVRAGEWRRGEPFRVRSLPYALLATGLVLLLAWPLLQRFHDYSGAWTLSYRPSVNLLQDSLEGAPPSLATRSWVKALLLYGKQFQSIMMGIVLVPLVIGMVRLKGGFRPNAPPYLLCLVAGYSLAPLWGAMAGYPLSSRYIMPCAVFAIPFAAHGLLVVHGACRARWNPKRVDVAFTTILVLFLLAISLRAVHPRRTEKIPIRDGALWLRDQAGTGRTIYSNASQVRYYAVTRTLLLPATREGLEELDLKEGEFIFVIESEFQERVPDGVDILNTRFRRIARFPREGEPQGDPVSIFAR